MQHWNFAVKRSVETEVLLECSALMESIVEPATKRLKMDVDIVVNWMDMPLDFWSNHVFPFVGNFQYRFVGGVCRTFQQAYTKLFPEKITAYNLSSFETWKICYDEVPKLETGKVKRLSWADCIWYKTVCDDAVTNRDSVRLSGSGKLFMQMIKIFVPGLLPMVIWRD
jgi:hypothetical protein